MASLDCHDALGEARARPRRPGQSEGERACRERPPGSREKRTRRRACLSGEEQAHPTAVTQHRQAPRNGAPCPGRYIGRSGDQSDELRPARSLGASAGVNRPGAPAVRPGHGPARPRVRGRAASREYGRCLRTCAPRCGTRPMLRACARGFRFRRSWPPAAPPVWRRRRHALAWRRWRWHECDRVRSRLCPRSRNPLRPGPRRNRP